MKKYYKYYFEQLAIRNKLIAHDPTKDDQVAFFFLKDKYDLNEFDNAIKSVGKTPAMLAENYFYDVEDNNSRNYFQYINGRFNIIDKADVGDQQSIDDVQTRCETIAQDIIAKMREELQEGADITIPDVGTSKMVFFAMQKIKVDFVGPMSTSYYGVTVGFTWKVPFPGRSNPDNWN